MPIGRNRDINQILRNNYYNNFMQMFPCKLSVTKIDYNVTEEMNIGLKRLSSAHHT